MSPRWRARLALGLIGVFMLVISVFKFPEIGWWGVGLSILFLVSVFTIVGREPKRPPRPFKQRRLINTAAYVAGMAGAYITSDLILDQGLTWDSWGIRLFFIVLLGLLGWLGTPADAPSAEDRGRGTR